MPARTPPKQLIVAVTGATGALGSVVLPRLLASPRVARVVAMDLARPESDDPKLVYEPLDLTRPYAANDAAAILADHRARALVHLAFFSSPVRDPAYAHEVEAIGTGHLLGACLQAGVRRLVVSGTTLVYGASPKNPNFLSEEHPLPAGFASRYLEDKLEAERLVHRFQEAHPSLRSTVLRFAPIVGPTVDNPFTRFLGRRLAPGVLGYDPLVQCLHEDDAAEATLLALSAGRPGPLNVVGRGVLPLSHAIRLAGARSVPLPMPFSSATLRALDALGLASVPPSLLDFLRYLWVADGARAERELRFRPRYSSREAILTFSRARRREAAAA
jgi:UDP-glucose 4-epimerase